MNHTALICAALILCATVTAGIKDLGFVSGSWRGTQGGSVIEEHWMEPEGDGIVGTARVVSGGKTRQTEIGLMEQRGESVVLLLRHFGNGQVAREEKDAPLLFVLKDLVGRRAEFVEEKSGDAARLRANGGGSPDRDSDQDCERERDAGAV